MSRRPSEMIFAVGLWSGRDERTMRSLKALSAAHWSFISIARITSAWPTTALRRNVWLSGWRDGKLVRPNRSNHGALQRLGKLDEPCHAGGRACHAVDHDERGLGVHQELRGLRYGARIGLRRDHFRQLG